MMYTPVYTQNGVHTCFFSEGAIWSGSMGTVWEIVRYASIKSFRPHSDLLNQNLQFSQVPR